MPMEIGGVGARHAAEVAREGFLESMHPHMNSKLRPCQQAPITLIAFERTQVRMHYIAVTVETVGDGKRGVPEGVYKHLLAAVDEARRALRTSERSGVVVSSQVYGQCISERDVGKECAQHIQKDVINLLSSEISITYRTLEFLFKSVCG